MNDERDTATISTATPPPVQQIAECTAPNWERFDRELLCPLCGYNLRGLADAKCPECGSAYTWDDLLDPRRRDHPYLFEHHPERNCWSFRRTLAGGLRPQAFWTTLSPLQPTSLPRLIGYAAVVWGLSIGVYVFAIAGQEFALRQPQSQNWRYVWVVSSAQPTVLEETLGKIASMQFVIACMGPIIWAGVTFLAFLLFGISMRKARVKSVHVARAVIYAFDAVLLVAIGLAMFYWLCGLILWYADGLETAASVTTGIWFLLTAIASYFWLTCRPELRQKRWAGLIMWPVFAASIMLGAMVVSMLMMSNSWVFLRIRPIALDQTVICLGFAVIMGRLVAAVRQYLQIKHAVAVVVTTQIITALAIPAGAIVISVVSHLF